MTKLTYIFPFIAGCFYNFFPLLRFTETSDIYAFENAVEVSFWVLLVTFVPFLCYGLTKTLIFLWNKKWKSFFTDITHFSLSTELLSHHKVVFLTLCNSVTGTVELLLLSFASWQQPRMSPVFVLSGSCVGFLLLGLLLDLTGWLWVQRQVPGELACSAATLLSLGILLVIIHPCSVAYLNKSIMGAFFLGVTSGCSSCVTHALTWKVIDIAECYWGGIFFYTLGMLVLLFILGLFFEQHFLWLFRGKKMALSADFPQYSLFFIVGMGRLLLILCVQFFAGVEGGYFTAIAPFVAGELAFSGVRDISQGIPCSSPPLVILGTLPFSVYTSSGLIFILLGSVFMWIARWTDTLIDLNTTPLVTLSHRDDDTMPPSNDVYLPLRPKSLEMRMLNETDCQKNVSCQTLVNTAPRLSFPTSDAFRFFNSASLFPISPKNTFFYESRRAIARTSSAIMLSDQRGDTAYSNIKVDPLYDIRPHSRRIRVPVSRYDIFRKGVSEATYPRSL